MLYFAICDDSPRDSAAFEQLMNDYFSNRHQLFELAIYSNGEMLLGDIDDGKHFDAVFLDTYMENGIGTEIARRVRERLEMIPIIFITSSTEHALEGFSVHAFDYIVKPMEKEKFIPMANRLMSVLNANRSKSLLVKFGSGGKRIAYSEIIYVESRNTVSYVHISSGESHRIYAKLSEIEAELNDSTFIRCHQSYIVNLQFVEEVSRQFKLSDGTIIPIRRPAVKEIRDKYYAYVMRHPIYPRFSETE